MAFSKINRRNKIKARIRGKVSGTSERPRMSVFRSNKQIYVQVINDMDGKTLVSAKSADLEGVTGDKKAIAAEVGKKIAEKAKAAGINAVVFDRNGYLYHGRVKALADAAREAGLNF